MFARLLTTIVLVVSLLFQSLAVVPLKKADDVQLKAVLISDIHADADPTRDRCNVLREILLSVGRHQNDADTLVMSGDLTNSGDLREYLNLNTFLNLYSHIGDRVPELGNHDSWHHSDDPDFATAEKYFKAFCLWNGIKTDTVYYAKQVNGFRFLVTGVEACDFKNPYHSAAQLDWLEKELTQAVSQAQPVFVICHKPVEDLGDAAERMEQILTAAAGTATAPIIYISGHCHEIGDNTYASPCDNLIYLNLPSVQYTDDGGLGFIAEIRANELTLTGMNLLTNEPLDGYAYRIAY
ncbi:MAG: metallophosphoesterase [Clostridia bacterium]|nr:metallophosphoesterase [Clostridia bacterium]